MFKIGDFSQVAQVSVRTLRHYDNLGLLKPAEIDRFTDYRYYTIEQLPRLNRIIALKDLGLSLEQIGRLLTANMAPEQLRGMLKMKQVEMERDMQDRQWQLARVEARLRMIEHEGRTGLYDIGIKEAPELVIASIRKIVPGLADMGQLCMAKFSELYDHLHAARIELCEPELDIFHNQEYTETDIDMEVATAIDPDARHAQIPGVTIRVLPAEHLVARVLHVGNWSDEIGAIQALFVWLDVHQHKIVGPLRELHLSARAPEISMAPSVVVELQLPVAPR